MESTLASGLTAATQQVQFDSIIQEFVSALRREGVADGYSSRHRGSARHFLTWLVRRDIPLRIGNGSKVRVVKETLSGEDARRSSSCGQARGASEPSGPVEVQANQRLVEMFERG